MAALLGSARQVTAQSDAPGPVLTDLVLRAGSVTYTIPRLEVRGTRLTQTDLARLADPNDPMPAADRLARLEADEVVVPSLTVDVAVGAAVTRATYRDVHALGVRNGKVASASAAGGTSASASDDQLTFGRVDVLALDLGWLLALSSETAKGPGDGMKPVYGSVVVNELRVGPADKPVLIGKVEVRDVEARPTADGWSVTSRKALAALGPAAADADRRVALVASADILDAFRIGTVDLSGITFADTNGGVTGRIARIALSGEASGQAGAVRLEGLDVQTPDGTVALASLALADLPFQRAVDGIRRVAASPSIAPDDLRRAMPLSGSVAASGFAFEGSAKAGTARTRVTVGAVRSSAVDPVAGIPTRLRIAVDDLAFGVPKTSADATLKQLLELGYESVDASFSTDVGFDEAARELTVREMSLSGAGMGSVALTGVLGNVSRDVFDPDTAVASVAWVGATAKKLDLAVGNAGLADRILRRLARQKGQTVEEIRRQYGSALAVGVPLMLGGSQPARSVGQAVGRFVAKPGRLAIHAAAKEPGGVGLVDMASRPDPAAILNRFSVTAEAE